MRCPHGVNPPRTKHLFPKNGAVLFSVDVLFLAVLHENVVLFALTFQISAVLLRCEKDLDLPVSFHHHLGQNVISST